ncbi:porin family protein [Pedobacter nutrimenti]|uniref:Outer membrane protein with beta-barrel domain n=1 Tax=Pedobacter nutrimenti TaxID=1241337 RepID=A0A318UL08_9SPHI|nr:porin family protein [Pedobacter nutrimenti]PYF74695.1 outer membrane protein with beta-barrel domain [Pedobacter nutrimenti]
MKTRFKKKKLLLLPLMAIALFSIPANAQNSSPIHIGLKAAGNFSSLSFSSEGLTSKYAPGFSAGAFARVDIARLYVQGELLYSRKTAELDAGSLGRAKASWNSIEAPVSLGYKILKTDRTSLRAYGGGVYSYVLNDHASLLGEVKTSFNAFDKSNIGYQVGVGVDLRRLTLDLRYEGSLSNLSSQFKSRPSSFQVSVGFMIF